MKTVSTTLLLLMVTLTNSAQLRVDSIGQIGIGTLTPKNTLTVYSDYTGGKYAVSIEGRNGLLVQRTYNNGTSWGYGIQTSSNHQTAYYSVGLLASSDNYMGNTIRGRSYGIITQAAYGHAGFNYGILANLNKAEDGQTGAAVYASTLNNDLGENTGGTYAGYFIGDTKIKGNVQITGGSVISNTVSTTNDAVSELTPLSSLRDNTTEKISTLTPYSYKQRPETLFLHTSQDDSDTIAQRNILTKSQQKYIEKTHYGIPIEEIEKYFPNLVYENEDGTKGVNYIEMIPLLIQSIKELNSRIEELQKR